MHYVVFVPGHHGQSPELLRTCGLADHMPGASFLPVRNGPGGEPGQIIFWGEQPAKYGEHDLEWLPLATPGEQTAQVGIDPEKLPTPAELARKQLFDGYLIPLGDGKTWRIPVASLLPQDLKLVSGQWTRQTQARFRDFWVESEFWYRHLVLHDYVGDASIVPEGMTAAEFDGKWMSYLIQALRLNYRITPEVVSRLSLFDTVNRVAVTNATISGMAIREAEESLQKKESPLSESGS